MTAVTISNFDIYQNLRPSQCGRSYSRIFKHYSYVLEEYLLAYKDNDLSSKIEEIHDEFNAVEIDVLSDSPYPIPREERLIVAKLVKNFFESGPLTIQQDGVKQLNAERFSKMEHPEWYDFIYGNAILIFFITQMGGRVVRDLSKSTYTAFEWSIYPVRTPKMWLCCYEYALLKLGTPKISYIATDRRGMTPESLTSWGFTLVEKNEPKKDDLVIYSKKGKITHAGLYLGAGRVESKMGYGSWFVLEHPLHYVHPTYGHEISYYRWQK